MGNMEYSTDYVNNLLDFAITRFHNNTEMNLKELPDTFNNIETAIENFKDSLEYEAHYTLNQEADQTDNPILYSVNLDSNEPGIVVGHPDNSNKVIVQTKEKKNA